MTTQYQTDPETRSQGRAFTLRTNSATAEIVEKAIALQDVCGTRCAAEFLRHKMIDIEVSTRVLCRQSARRRSR